MLDLYANISIEEKQKHLHQVQNYIDQLYQSPQLTSLFIEMTLNCNEHCRHCGSRCGDIQMKDQLTDQEIMQFLCHLKNQLPNLPFLNITGGEPLLRPGFIELMHNIAKLGYNWGMTSNGTLIDQDMIYKLHYAGMKTISISIDGLEHTHNWFRQTKDGFQKSINAIRLLSDANFKNIMITTVVHKQNINELYQMYDFIKQLHVDTWRLINIEPIGRAKDNTELLLDHNDYITLLDFIKTHRISENNFEICFGCNHWLGVENEHKFRNWYYKCSAGIKTGGIFYNGDIGACLDIERKPNTIQGNIRTNDFLDIWQNKFQIYRYNRANDSDYCKHCSEKTNCRGGGFHTWNVKENKPELCLYQHYCERN